MISRLRDMVEDDLPLVLSWRNAEDVRTNMYTNHLISIDEHRRWWELQNANPESRLLIFELDQQPLGVVTFSRYTGANSVAQWAFYSGNRGQRGIGSMMERAALEYAFETLRVRKLECEVLAFNRPVVNFHVKHGFRVEGVLREAYERGGTLIDVYRLGMLASEWTKHVKPALAADLDGDDSGKLSGRRFKATIDLSEEAISRYADATGDHNPLHMDNDYARSRGFSGRIAHGMLVGGELSRIFSSEFPGPGTLYVSQSMEFKAPLLVGASAQVELKVTQQLGRRLQIEIEVSQDERLCVVGTSVLMLPRGEVSNAEL